MKDIYYDIKDEVFPHDISPVGVAAMSGVSISGEVYAWVVVFLLPINSAINPVLYTISSIQIGDRLRVSIKSVGSLKTWDH